MTEREFKNRTKKVAVQAGKLVDGLGRTKTAEVYGLQLIRSSSSVGANYRSACRARSDAEMASRMGIAEDEADESQYWLELLVESGDLTIAQAKPVHKEFNEIIALLVASRRTLRDRIQRKGSVVRDVSAVYGVLDADNKNPNGSHKRRTQKLPRSSKTRSNRSRKQQSKIKQSSNQAI